MPQPETLVIVYLIFCSQPWCGEATHANVNHDTRYSFKSLPVCVLTLGNGFLLTRHFFADTFPVL